MADDGDQNSNSDVPSTGASPGGVTFTHPDNILGIEFNDKEFLTATASAAVQEGLVFVDPDRRANAYVHEGSVINYNLPVEEQEDKPEVTAELAEKRITARANWTTRQLDITMRRQQSDSGRWFSLMLASGVLTLIALFVGGGLFIAGSIGSGAFSEMFAVVTGCLTKFFHGKDSELRKDLQEAENRLNDMNRILLSFEIASTIEDKMKRTKAKQHILGKALDVPNSD